MPKENDNPAFSTQPSAFSLAEVPPDLVSSALFGHEKGAFSGAVKERKGLIKSGLFPDDTSKRRVIGHLFLDEIAEMASDSQVKLLRIMEGKEVFPVGSDSPLSISKDNHLVVFGATNRNISKMIKAGQFRQRE